MHPKIFPPSKKKTNFIIRNARRAFNARSCELQRKKEKLRPADNPQIHPLFKLRKENKKTRLGNSAKRDIIAIRETAIPDCKLYLSTKQIRAIKALPGKGAEPPITGKCHAR